MGDEPLTTDLFEGPSDSTTNTVRTATNPASTTSWSLTPTGRGTLIVSIMAVLAGWLIGLPEAHALAAGAASALIVSAARALIVHPRLSVRRTVSPERVSAGGTFESIIEVRNESRRRSVPVAVIDEHVGLPIEPFAVASIPPMDSVALGVPVHTSRRGTIAVGPTRFTLLDPFRLVERTTTTDTAEDLVVWPHVWTIVVPLDPSRGDGGTVRSTTLPTRTQTEEFSTLGEYVPGDDPRHVHWPSSARVGRLVVKRFDTPEPRRTHVVLERFADNPMAFDVAVSLCASTLVTLSSEDEIISLSTADVDHAMMSADATRFDIHDRRDLGPAMDHLAVVQPQLRIPGDRDQSDDGLLNGRLSSIVAALPRDHSHRVERLIVIGPESPKGRNRTDPESALRERLAGSPTIRWVSVPTVASMPSMDLRRAQDLVDGDDPLATATGSSFIGSAPEVHQ